MSRSSPKILIATSERTPGDQLGHAELDRLAEAVRQPGMRLSTPSSRLRAPPSCRPASTAGGGVQHHDDVADVHAHGVGGDLRPPGLRDDRADLVGKRLAEPRSTSVACWTDSSSDTLGRRRIWSANAPSSSRGMNSAPRNGDDQAADETATARPRPRTGPAAAGATSAGAYQRLNHRTRKTSRSRDPPAEQQRGEHRRERERQEQRADQREHHSDRHRREQLPLDPCSVRIGR